MKPLEGWYPSSWFSPHLPVFDITALKSPVSCSYSRLAEVYSFLCLLSKVACLHQVFDFLGCKELFDSFIGDLLVKLSSQKPKFKPTIQRHLWNCCHILYWHQQNALLNLLALTQFF
jgi:hypothetical protein